MNIFVQGSYSLLPRLHETPRVARDIEQLLTFISRQPWGDVFNHLCLHRAERRALARTCEHPSHPSSTSK